MDIEAHGASEDGYPRGYDQGCRCVPCVRAHTAYCKQMDSRRHGNRLSDGQHTDAAPATLHLRQVMAQVPDAVPFTVQLATGVTVNTVMSLLDGCGRTKVKTLRTICALTPDQLEQHLSWVPAETVHVLASRLRAAGYSLGWQGRQVGHYVTWYSRRPARLSRVIADDWQALYDRVGWRPASVSDGLGLHDIGCARNAAAAAGWKPSYCYSENGEFLARALPEHPWAVLDRRAERRLDIARGLLGGVDRSVIAGRVGCSRKDVERTAKRVGVYAPNPDRVADTRRMRVILAGYDERAADPVRTALEMGLLLPRPSWAGHPGYDEWLAAQDERVAA